VVTNIPPAYDGESLRSEDHGLLARPVPAFLSTVNPSGTPQQTVMWYRFEEGNFLFITRTDRAKYRNFLRNPRASVMVVDPDSIYRWIIAAGTLSVDEREPESFYRSLAARYLSGKRLEAWQTVANFDLLTVMRLVPDRIITRYKSTFD
jgi:PPOX class probable F420-dependent enzyme